VVIVARAMGIPVVGQVVGALPRWRKTATRSLSMARMAPFICARLADVQNAYADKVRFRAKRQEQYRALRTVESRTRDGQYVTPADECRAVWSTCRS
jgi:phosphotransferase system enzyme I (PtsP)